jgi:hypothetical protein
LFTQLFHYGINHDYQVFNNKIVGNKSFGSQLLGMAVKDAPCTGVFNIWGKKCHST